MVKSSLRVFKQHLKGGGDQMIEALTQMHTEPTPTQIKQSRIYQKWSLTQIEYEQICQQLGRLPNYTETGLFAAMWSEHCSYKKSKPVLKQFWSINENVIQGPGEGAGVIDIGDNQAIVFKAESHNHPSAVEPYQGAATGVGGIIRDIFSMGAQPIAILDSLRFGELQHDLTKRLVNGVVSGIADYGNSLGIPNVGGDVYFDDSYLKNPVMNAMAVGLLNQDDLHVGQADGIGNRILYVGAKTGRDGIQGATFASSEFDSSEDQNRSAVQVGDPFLEKLLMDTTLQAIKDYGEAIVGVQDMGAAGLVSSSAEMAGKAGNGIELNLDLVPQRETNLSPYELMLSESQERMLLVVKADQIQSVAGLFESAGLVATDIGQVTDDGRYRLTFGGQIVCDIEVQYLITPPKQNQLQQRPVHLDHGVAKTFEPKITEANQVFLDLLSQSTIASKAYLFKHYDCSVRTDTVIKPGGDAGVVRIKDTKKALAFTTDVNSRFVYLDPKIGGQLAVAEAARNIVTTGATPIGITDCLNFGNPDDPEHYYEFAQACQGINEMAKKLNTPIISGNVSLYNETDGQEIYPTPIIGMAGLLKDIDHLTTASFKQVGDSIYVIGRIKPDFNGSELQKLMTDQIFGALADFDLDDALHQQSIVLDGINDGLINGAHDVSEGGLAVTLFEMTNHTSFGLDVQMEMPISWFFAETPSVFVVTVPARKQSQFEQLVGQDAQLIGQVIQSDRIKLKGQDQIVDLLKAQATRQYEEAIEWQMTH